MRQGLHQCSIAFVRVSAINCQFVQHSHLYHAESNNMNIPHTRQTEANPIAYCRTLPIDGLAQQFNSTSSRAQSSINEQAYKNDIA